MSRYHTIRYWIIIVVDESIDRTDLIISLSSQLLILPLLMVHLIHDEKWRGSDSLNLFSEFVTTTGSNAIATAHFLFFSEGLLWLLYVIKIFSSSSFHLMVIYINVCRECFIAF